MFDTGEDKNSYNLVSSSKNAQHVKLNAYLWFAFTEYSLFSKSVYYIFLN